MWFNPSDKKDPFDFEEMSFESKDHKEDAKDFEFEKEEDEETKKNKSKRCVIL